MAGTGAPRARLHIEADLQAGASVELAREQAHYLTRVLRLGTGDQVALFNGRDGEWGARIETAGKNTCVLTILEQRRPQRGTPDLWLLFAPVKRAPIDLLVQKATELGVAALHPVTTDRTVVDRVNTGRLRAIAIEAAEQCERLDVPTLANPIPLNRLLDEWPTGRHLLVCDESGQGEPIAPALGKAMRGPSALLCGPEGGFAPAELDALRKLPFVTAVGLGPRILRAETAAIAALAIWQALLGDWADPPPGRTRDRTPTDFDSRSPYLQD